MWRCGEVIIRPAGDPVEAAWVARALDRLHVVDAVIAQPLRSSDGRWVVAGWTATRFMPGRPEPRHDEVVAVSLRLHEATAEVERPEFFDTRRDIVAMADWHSWGEREVRLNPEQGGRLFDLLVPLRRQVFLAQQLVHADLFGNVLFHRSSPPVVTGFLPYWRPVEWAAAVIVVDALAWGGADQGIVRRWAHLAEWSQMLLRAALFRLAVHALHPGSTAESLRGLQRAAHQVTEIL